MCLIADKAWLTIWKDITIKSTVACKMRYICFLLRSGEYREWKFIWMMWKFPFAL